MNSVCIVVLGMHRSGTSAVAGALAAAGIPFGGDLIGAADDNEAGYWENKHIVAKHDELLSALGSSWDDVMALPENWAKSGVAQRFKDDLKSLAADQLAASPVWGLKDPRLCRLLPLWCEIFDDLGCRVHFVLTHRHPVEVAASLKKRNQFSEAKSLCLWLQHNLFAEYYSRDRSRSFTSLEEFQRDPTAELARMLGAVETRIGPLDRSSMTGTDLVDQNLVHHRFGGGELTWPGTPYDRPAMKVFECLSAAVRCENHSGALDLRETREWYLSKFSRQAEPAVADHVADLNREIQESNRECAALAAFLSEITGSLPYRLSWPVRKARRIFFNPIQHQQ